MRLKCIFGKKKNIICFNFTKKAINFLGFNKKKKKFRLIIKNLNSSKLRNSGIQINFNKLSEFVNFCDSKIRLKEKKNCSTPSLSESLESVFYTIFYLPEYKISLFVVFSFRHFLYSLTREQWEAVNLNMPYQCCLVHCIKNNNVCYEYSKDYFNVPSTVLEKLCLFPKNVVFFESDFLYIPLNCRANLKNFNKLKICLKNNSQENFIFPEKSYKINYHQLKKKDSQLLNLSHYDLLFLTPKERALYSLLDSTGNYPNCENFLTNLSINNFPTILSDCLNSIESVSLQLKIEEKPVKVNVNLLYCNFNF